MNDSKFPNEQVTKGSSWAPLVAHWHRYLQVVSLSPDCLWTSTYGGSVTTCRRHVQV